MNKQLKQIICIEFVSANHFTRFKNITPILPCIDNVATIMHISQIKYTTPQQRLFEKIKISSTPTTKILFIQSF